MPKKISRREALKRGLCRRPPFPLARQAGVHLYLKNGDQVIAEHNYLAVHAGFDGEREIKLPVARKVVDAMTGEAVAANTDRIKTNMKKGQTGIWQLSAVG